MAEKHVLPRGDTVPPRPAADKAIKSMNSLNHPDATSSFSECRYARHAYRTSSHVAMCRLQCQSASHSNLVRGLFSHKSAAISTDPAIFFFPASEQHLGLVCTGSPWTAQKARDLHFLLPISAVWGKKQVQLCSKKPQSHGSLNTLPSAMLDKANINLTAMKPQDFLDTILKNVGGAPVRATNSELQPAVAKSQFLLKHFYDAEMAAASDTSDPSYNFEYTSESHFQHSFADRIQLSLEQLIAAEYNVLIEPQHTLSVSEVNMYGESLKVVNIVPDYAHMTLLGNILMVDELKGPQSLVLFTVQTSELGPTTSAVISAVESLFQGVGEVNSRSSPAQVWSQMTAAGTRVGRLCFGTHHVYFHWLPNEAESGAKVNAESEDMVKMAFTVIAQNDFEPYTATGFYHEVIKRLSRDPDYRCVSV